MDATCCAVDHSEGVEERSMLVSDGEGSVGKSGGLGAGGGWLVGGALQGRC